jgi:hypothetical protein
MHMHMHTHMHMHMHIHMHMQSVCSAHAVVCMCMCMQRLGLMRTLMQIAKEARGSPSRSTCVSRPRSALCRRTRVAHLV